MQCRPSTSLAGKAPQHPKVGKVLKAFNQNDLIKKVYRMQETAAIVMQRYYRQRLGRKYREYYQKYPHKLNQ